MDLLHLFLEFTWHIIKAVLGIGNGSVNTYKPSNKGYVYFVQGVNGGPIKIGYSAYLDKRLSNLQTGNAEQLKMIAYIPGDIGLEKRLHKKFDKYRIRPDGEWFVDCEDIRNFISINCFKA